MPITLTYFDIRGRGEPIRLLLQDAGVEYVDDNDVAKFQANKMDYDLFPFNQLPVLELEDGTRLVQQDAVLRFLAEKYDYTVGSTAMEKYQISMLACAIDDLNNFYVDSCYSKKEPIGCELLPFIEGRCAKIYSALEHIASKSSTEFLFGAKPAFPEFTLLHLTHAIQVLSPQLLSAYPKLAAWEAKMSARPNLKAYFESGKQRKMINGTTNGLESVC